jgi:hypothetical protein
MAAVQPEPWLRALFTSNNNNILDNLFGPLGSGNLYRFPLPSLVGTGSILSNIKSYRLRKTALSKVQLVGNVWQQFPY